MYKNISASFHPDYLFLKPLLTEQFASFLNRKSCAFKMFQASSDYSEVKCYEHSHMCKFIAFNLIHEKGQLRSCENGTFEGII